jgi:hypothetical protein
MNILDKYNTFCKKKQITILLVVVFAVVAVLTVSCCLADDGMITCWVMCKPGSRVNVRRTPGGTEIGYLECGDWFETDAVEADGWIRCYGIGEYGEGWVWCGYVATEEPEKIGVRYRVASNGLVIIRKWMNGPKVDGRCYLTNGSTVQVFCIADGWAVTNRGYIMAEYLEADPE